MPISSFSPCGQGEGREGVGGKGAKTVARVATPSHPSATPLGDLPLKAGRGVWTARVGKDGIAMGAGGGRAVRVFGGWEGPLYHARSAMTDLLDTAPDAAPNVPEYSVGEIAGALKRQIEDSFGRVRVKGEIGRIYRAASGHAYLTLKDSDAVLEGICFRNSWARLKFQPEEGLEVVVTGKLTTFAKKSQYQIIIESVAPAGVGALMALLEERRKKLQAEGLFDEVRKKDIPLLPEVIGVVTSPTGVVIRDILHRIADRFPRKVLVWPVKVQGDGAAEEIAAAIRGFNQFKRDGIVPRPDVLIVARGGGSLEDLWAFNEEVVVRAAAASDIPLISAVGHETDWTLIDHAADRRAPTPTAAAEMAVPVRLDLLADVQQAHGRLTHAMTRMLQENRIHLEGLVRGIPRLDVIVEQKVQDLDVLSGRLQRGPETLLQSKKQEMAVLSARLNLDSFRRDIVRHQQDLAATTRSLLREGKRVLQDKATELKGLSARIESVAPKRVLERGYAMVKSSDGKVVSRASDASPGAALKVSFGDGDIGVHVDGVPLKRTRSGSKKNEDKDQGRLL